MKLLARDIMLNPIYWIDEITNISSVCKKLMKMNRAFTNFARHIVLQKSQHIEENCSSGTGVSNEDGDSEKKGLCFIDHVITVLSKQMNSMTMDELTEHTITMVTAAMDMSVMSLCIVLKLLGLHADVQDRVVKEQKDIFGHDWGSSVTPEDLRRMVYLEQVMKETFRLFPVIPLIVRNNSHELRLTTHTLPAGSSIAIPIYIVHRDPRNFTDPLPFDPDRFNPEAALGHHPFSIIPFSAGRRNCIGYMYAMMKLKTILSTVLRKYEFLPCGSREAMESWDFNITLLLKNGYNVRFIPRKL
ncbi:hypothetical protein PR048_027366 [Dryococelus australis]|uniref:Cytochrome P450 n=1 Tax=Dryococelus australis TaxID=614101 RepID=A0ABQ9GGD9_9NEOP|nr:hypothetical protein PR048_027366 [Dryococelus australis]